MNNAERLEILRQVENGQVSVEDAIGKMAPASNSAPPALPQPTSAQRWLRVRVTNLDTGKRKVSVNIPAKLVKWGLALGCRYAPELEDLDWDELMADLDEYAEGHLVEVEDEEGNERVEVFID
jgi:hypothetical protein